MTSLILLAVLMASDAGSADAGVRVPGSCSAKPIICFSPKGQCEVPLVELIGKARKTLDIAIYAINRQSIVQAILRAKRDGVVVRIIIDSSQMADEKELIHLSEFRDAMIPLKRDTHQGVMHLKMVIVDDTWLMTGSFNFTNNASENNDENVLIWKCAPNALVYKQEFELRWAKFKDAYDQLQKNLNLMNAGRDAGTKDAGLTQR